MALYLADSSAWHRSARASERWRSLLEGYGLALCTPVTLELLFSARDRTDYELLARDLGAFPHLPVDAEVEVAAERTQAALATQGQHRGPTPVDLLIAAVAEVHGATLLHYDRHFDAIARVTGQPMEWLARRGRLT